MAGTRDRSVTVEDDLEVGLNALVTVFVVSTFSRITLTSVLAMRVKAREANLGGRKTPSACMQPRMVDTTDGIPLRVAAPRRPLGATRTGLLSASFVCGSSSACARFLAVHIRPAYRCIA